MGQNRDTLIEEGSQGRYPISGNVNDYVRGVNGSRVGQFYPQ